MRRFFSIVLLLTLFSSAFSQWQFMGLSNRSVRNLTSINDVLFAGTDNRIYKSTDDGVTWTPVPDPSPYFFTFSVQSIGNNLIAWSYDDGTYNSTDMGETWTQKSQVPNQFNFFKVINNDLFAGHPHALFRSKNAGLNYDQISIGVDFDSRGVAIKDNDIWSCSYNQGLFHSTNNGQSWTNLTSGISSQKFSDITRVDDIIIAATRGEAGINRSTDNGQTWSIINSNWDVSTFYIYANNIFAFKYGYGNEAGPIRSTDNGQTWIYANEGLGANVSVFFKFKDYLFAGCEVGQGVYRRNLSDWSLPSNIKDANLTDKTFKLHNNYPNPFNPSTKISFAINNKDMVSLKIFNNLGQEITTLVNEEMKSGQYEYDFNAKGLNTGVYYYTLTVGENSITKPMVLIK